MSLNVESVEFKAFILFILQEIKNSFLRPKLNATIFLRTTILTETQWRQKRASLWCLRPFHFPVLRPMTSTSMSLQIRGTRGDLLHSGRRSRPRPDVIAETVGHQPSVAGVRLHQRFHFDADLEFVRPVTGSASVLVGVVFRRLGWDPAMLRLNGDGRQGLGHGARVLWKRNKNCYFEGFTSQRPRLLRHGGTA